MPAFRTTRALGFAVTIGLPAFAAAALALGSALAQPVAASGGDAAAVAHGQALAERRCLSCHQVEQARDPLMPGPPTFLSLKARFSRSALETRLKEIGENGHYDTERDTYGMPAVDLKATQIADIAAYIQSLQPSGPPDG